MPVVARLALIVIVSLPAVLLPVGTGLGQGPFAHRDDLEERDRARVARVVAPATTFVDGEPFEALAGGAATTRTIPTEDSYSQPSANLSAEDHLRFSLGNALFRKLWVSAPSSTQASDGLGPLYNARACQSCHIRDGRGRAPNGTDAETFVLQLVRPDGADGFGPDPTYGRQLQDAAIPGLDAEGRVAVDWTYSTVRLADGTTVELRRPTFSVSDARYGPFHPDTRLSPRIATPMIGLGLLEAIHPGDILANADPHDRDGDGISGRPSLVPAPGGEARLGRFGWKASEPDVDTQTAQAFRADIGLSSPWTRDPWGDCTPAQTACLSRPHGIQVRLGEDEVPQDVFDLVSFYARNLAVPVRRTVKDRSVLAGKRVFYEADCAKCHVPKFVTRRDAKIAELSFQLIWPYTDMLLHDMGEELADGTDAPFGREWRTPPLWGIGLAQTVFPDAGFLHDGRARTLLEAVLWHGGEAKAARDHVVSLDRDSREALLAFLNSL